MPYIVKSRIKHNGEVFEEVGAPFAPGSITPEQTRRLLARGAIEKVPAKLGRPPKEAGDA